MFLLAWLFGVCGVLEGLFTDRDVREAGVKVFSGPDGWTPDGGR